MTGGHRGDAVSAERKLIIEREFDHDRIA